MLQLPRLRPDQASIARHPAKVKVVTAGRRYGKTVLGGRLVMEVLSRHGRVAWITPTYKNSRPLWRWAVQVTAPAVKAGMMLVSQTERTITTKRNGHLMLFSGDNIDSIRGEAFNLVVLDEAARLTEDAWNDAIMPTLADYDGDAVLISTPKGKNWFHKEYLMGKADGAYQASWQAPTSANPNPNIQRAFAMARQRVPEATFQQEWLAEFIEGGLVFRNLVACMGATEADHTGHALYMGVDWGKQNDWTAISIGCQDCRCEVAHDRFNQIDYSFQRARLGAMADKWQVTAILPERNSIGDPIIEQLLIDGLPILAGPDEKSGFMTTPTTKPQLIENLALAFEREEWQFQADPIWTGELEAYERQISPVTGRSQYSAPAGMHDDTVIARALMVWAATNAASWLLA